MKVQEIIRKIEEIAPKDLACYPEDNNGLLIGSYSADVSKVLLALDLTSDVLDEAIKLNCQLIVTHHPFIFKGLKNIRDDMEQGRLIIKGIKNNINVYCAHTNLDVVDLGVTEALRKKLEFPKGTVLHPTEKEGLSKLVVYVPKENAHDLLLVISKAGAGHIGRYSHCSFMTEGEGTFKPLEGSNPYIGKVGSIEKVQEIKLETIVPNKILSSVIKMMIKAHPYEEVAYDIIPLNNTGKVFGLGSVIELEEPIKVKELAEKVKEKLHCQGVKIFSRDLDKKISKVAICGGSGGSLIQEAKFAGCQCLITGDIDYHKGQMAVDLGLTVIDAGHYYTEVPVLEHLRELVNDKLEDVEVYVTKVNTCPYIFL
ncbi:Nif3-like dinuclear metal center hexameric protein [Anaerobranca gottschalkii]|uniref:GTP cyclohydrolase 1 type 2 homolog n=1 Tax=Anaerobranca gottschalkii DSM 13577 TaxID=1120990 RepID=A0A1H9Y0C4_9FIRM|nr:Nif3-like dinuclear metal center hexameric protein [Anaerobranca gottschalkii]SES62079.1 dinuclear metal center protein, YbgI/SA1388 family [Anaerobranca gottschalkii DSM 13577]